MQKIVASTKSNSLKRAEASAIVAFLSFMVTHFYGIGAGFGKLSLNAVLNLATQDPDLELLALYWGTTEALFCLSVCCVLLAIVEYFSQKTTQPRWVAVWLKPNLNFNRMIDGLYWSGLLFLVVGFTAQNLGADVSQIQLFDFTPTFKMRGFLLLLLSLGQGTLVLSGLFALLGVMTNLSALKKPVKKA